MQHASIRCLQRAPHRAAIDRAPPRGATGESPTPGRRQADARPASSRYLAAVGDARTLTFHSTRLRSRPDPHTIPPAAADMDDAQARVADYLDDKLQTPQDLDSLDQLLENIHTQHGLLKQQLHDAQRDLHDAKQASHHHHASLRDRAAAFRQDQADIDRRLLVVAASETSDDAVPRFEQVLDTLQRLDVANAYIDLLQDVDALR